MNLTPVLHVLQLPQVERIKDMTVPRDGLTAFAHASALNLDVFQQGKSYDENAPESANNHDGEEQQQ